MKPANYPLKISRGKPLDITVTWRDADGNPIDLTGYKASLQIRRSAEDADSLEDWVDGPGGEITLGGKSGTVTVQLAGTATKDMTWEAGVYDLVVGKGEKAIPLLLGKAEVE